MSTIYNKKLVDVMQGANTSKQVKLKTNLFKCSSNVMLDNCTKEKSVELLVKIFSLLSKQNNLNKKVNDELVHLTNRYIQMNCHTTDLNNQSVKDEFGRLLIFLYECFQNKNKKVDNLFIRDNITKYDNKLKDLIKNLVIKSQLNYRDFISNFYYDIQINLKPLSEK